MESFSMEALEMQNTQELANLVRNWVHFDNLATSLSKQATNARKLRDDFETNIITMLQSNQMENATIQIHGGKLVIQNEKHSQPLTFTRLEDQLHKYFLEKRVQNLSAPDETTDILKFLRKHREVEVSKKLKKVPIVPSLPPPPPLPNS
jgi:hypothetical protein